MSFFVHDDTVLASVVTTFFVGLYLQSDALRSAFKHWPVLILAARVLLSGASVTVAFGLLFGAIGDWALEQERLGAGKVWFLVGLGSFLVGHVAYALAFYRAIVKRSRVVDWRVLGAAWAVAAGVFGGLTRFGRISDDMVVPVALYALTIMSMLGLAVLTRNRDALVGSVFFVASDLALAIDRFVQRVPLATLVIMTTYFVAQYFVARSASKLN